MIRTTGQAVVVALTALIGLVNVSGAQVTIETVAVTGDEAPGTGGARFASFSKPALNEAGQTAFQGRLELGTGSPPVTNASQVGMWSEGSGDLALVARAGDPAPGAGGALFQSFYYGLCVLNGAGRMAFNGTLVPGTGFPPADSTNQIGIWSEGSGSLALVARRGDPAPGTGGALFQYFYDGPNVLNEAGQIGFHATLRWGTGTPPAGISNFAGIWSEDSGGLALKARVGDPAPGTGGALWDYRWSFSSANNGVGRWAFGAALTEGTGTPPVDSTNHIGIWSEGSEGSLAPVARQGEPAPGTGGALFSNFSLNPVLNDAGHTLFRGWLSNDPGGGTSPPVTSANDFGIWSNDSGSLALVARKGNIAPDSGGALFRSLDQPVVSKTGQKAFGGSLEIGSGTPPVDVSNYRALWSEGSGNLALVARQGDPAPGTGGALWDLFQAFSLNEAGQTAFFGALKLDTGTPPVAVANNWGIWVSDPSGNTRLILRGGDQIEVQPGDFRTLLYATYWLPTSSADQDGILTSMNNGRIALVTVFTDYTSAIVVVSFHNQAPVAHAGGPYSVDEGSSVMLDASGSSDPDGDALTFEWDFDYDGTNFEVDTTGEAPTFPTTGLDGPTSVTVAVRATDAKGAQAIATSAVAINNVAPEVGDISVLQTLVPVNTGITASASFTDDGTLDTHVGEFDWADGSTTLGTVSESGGSGMVTSTHSYAVPGVYTLTLTVTDDDLGIGSSMFKYVVVYDPADGFVSGAGTIMSPAGAYSLDPSLTGLANFGFVAKYVTGASTPTGHTMFRFQAGGLQFRSDSYQWLVVAGARAQFKGTGTIKDRPGSFGFFLTAIDGAIAGGGGTDKFRIKIWNANDDSVVYDNQLGATADADPSTEIQDGSIVIHTGDKGNSNAT